MGRAREPSDHTSEQPAERLARQVVELALLRSLRREGERRLGD